MSGNGDNQPSFPAPLIWCFPDRTYVTEEWRVAVRQKIEPDAEATPYVPASEAEELKRQRDGLLAWAVSFLEYGGAFGGRRPDAIMLDPAGVEKVKALVEECGFEIPKRCE